MAQAQFRPENVLRRARDFESSGDKDKALDHLYEVLAARKLGRQWQPAHELMMMKFVELAVEYREGRKCKEGLHAYRNLAQQQQPASLEKVVLALIDMSMRKADEARARTDSAAQLDSVEDLEAEESPETLLMGAVTSEGSKDRAEREILLPWVRFMWDTYRNVLDVLRNTPLENLYHAVARRAMQFCNKYNRAAEYRKLTALLRTHLLGIRRNLDQQGKGMSTESVEKHVGTRFAQLEHCAEMSMWNEGFRTIEDIHEIMEGAGFTPKPQLMATYYEKLSRIFWVSENYLFHAYAWYRFWSLCTQNRALTEEDRHVLADATVLAAMAIPIYSSGATAGAGAVAGGASTTLDVDVDERNKKTALAALLRVPTPTGLGPVAAGVPSRSALLAEIVSKGVLRMVHPEVAALYRCLEGEFDPLKVVEKAKVGLGWVSANVANTLRPTIGIVGSSTAAGAHSLAQYAPKLERLTVFRLLEQLSAVYSTVTVAHFTSLIAPLKLSFHDVEKIAVKSVKERLLSVRIDHRGGVLRLGSRDGGDVGATRRQLAELMGRLQNVLDGTGLDAPLPSSDAFTPVVVPAARRDEVLASAKVMVDVARKWVQERKQTLQRRKEVIEMHKIQAQKEREDAAFKHAEAQKAQEAKRLMEEEAARIEAKRKEIEDAQKKDEMLKMIAAAGRSMKDLEAAAAAHMDMATLQAQALERAKKEQDTETRRRTEQSRRVDYLIRALREAERAKIEVHLESLHAEEGGHVRAHNDGILARARKQFDDATAMKSSMSKIMPYVEAYEARVMKARLEVYHAQKKHKQDAERLVFLREKKQRALKTKEMDERRKAEEAHLRREADRKAADLEEEERLRQRELKRQQSDEESRRMREEASGPGDVRRGMGAPSSGPSADGPSPWRRGEAAAVAAAPSATPSAEPFRAKAPGASYVPPSQRGATAGDGSWRGGAGGPSASVPAAAPAQAPPAMAARPAAGGSYVPPALRAAQMAANPQQQQQQQPPPPAAPAAVGRSWK